STTAPSIPERFTTSVFTRTTLEFRRDFRCASDAVFYGSPNAYTALPAAIATYSLPFTAKAIGAAYTAPPIWKCHSALPVAASSAMKFPSASPVNTRPPAVDSTPDHVGDVCSNFHLISPVAGSIALRNPRYGSASSDGKYALP